MTSAPAPPISETSTLRGTPGNRRLFCQTPSPVLPACKDPPDRGPSALPPGSRPRLPSLPSLPRAPLNLRLATRGAVGSGSSSQADPWAHGPFSALQGAEAARVAPFPPGRLEPKPPPGPSRRRFCPGPPRLLSRCGNALPRSPGLHADRNPRQARLAGPRSNDRLAVFPAGPCGWKQVYSWGCAA